MLATHRTRRERLTRPKDRRHRGCCVGPESYRGGTWNARVGFYRANKARKRTFPIVLIPLSHHAEESKVPADKSVRIIQ